MMMRALRLLPVLLLLAVGACASGGVQNRLERFVVSERVEIRIPPGDRPVFAVEGDGALEMDERLRQFASLRMRATASM